MSIKNAKIKTRLSIELTCLLVAFVFASSIAKAEQSTEVSQAVTKEQLEKAKEVLLKAEQAAQDIIKAAELEAEEIVASAGMQSASFDQKRAFSPLYVKNESVAVELQGATVEEIANALMPEEWRVLVDVKDPAIKDKRFQFVSTNTRDQALANLTKSMNLTYRYFFDLKDQNGNSSPLLVISEK